MALQTDNYNLFAEMEANNAKIWIKHYLSADAKKIFWTAENSVNLRNDVGSKGAYCIWWTGSV